MNRRGFFSLAALALPLRPISAVRRSGSSFIASSATGQAQLIPVNLDGKRAILEKVCGVPSRIWYSPTESVDLVDSF